MSKPLYKDINSNFSVLDKNLILEDDYAIVNSLINLFSTVKGDRPFKYYLGCDIVRLLFDPICPLTASYIRDEIVFVSRYEPRCELVERETTVTPSDTESSYNIVITIINKATKIKSSYNLVFNRS